MFISYRKLKIYRREGPNLNAIIGIILNKIIMGKINKALDKQMKISKLVVYYVDNQTLLAGLNCIGLRITLPN